MTGGSSESDENDIKSPTQVSLPDALTTIKREMPPRNDQGKPVYNWNKLCAVVLVCQLLLAPTPSAAATCSPLLGQVVPFNRLADADVARTATPVSTTPSDPALGWTYFRPGPKSSRHEGHVSRSRSSVLT